MKKTDQYDESKSDSEPYSLDKAKAQAEIKSLNSQTFKNRMFGVLCVTCTICVIHFYGLLLPNWQVTWNKKFFGNLDVVADTIEHGSNRVGSEIAGIKSEMVEIKSEMVSMKKEIVVSMNHIGQSTDHQMRVMNGQFGRMNKNVVDMNPMNMIPGW